MLVLSGFWWHKRQLYSCVNLAALVCMQTHQEITCFDNNFFGIREDEVKTMAPNQRLILEDGYACLRKAGFDRKSLAGRNTAAFLGDTGADWDPFWQIKALENPRNPGRPVPYGNCEGSHLTYGQTLSFPRSSFCISPTLPNQSISSQRG